MESELQIEFTDALLVFSNGDYNEPFLAHGTTPGDSVGQ